MRKLKSKDKECKPRNIVSKKNAVITRIEAEKGEIVKKKDDYIEELYDYDWLNE